MPSSTSPTVNNIPPMQQNFMKNGYDENKGYGESYENEVNENYSITNNNWNNAYTNKQTTKQNTNDDVDVNGTRGVHALSLHALRICSTVVIVSHFTFHGSSSERIHTSICMVIHGAFSLIRPLPSSFTFPSCPSPSTSSSPSCSLSSTTRSSWQVCATPPQMRVRTP